MQLVLIAMLFVILAIALTLGFVIYRLSNTATIKDFDRIVDDVNNLQTELKNADAQLKKDYVKLNIANSNLYVDLSVVKRSNSNLSESSFSNSSNISRLQSKLATDYLTTTALNSNLSKHDFSFLHLDDSLTDKMSYLKVSGSNLQFCTAPELQRNGVRTSESCSNVRFVDSTQ
jgi:uncharacterized membrane-anchored protein YhcB (DUF1043 family)